MPKQTKKEKGLTNLRQWAKVIDRPAKKYTCRVCGLETTYTGKIDCEAAHLEAASKTVIAAGRVLKEGYVDGDSIKLKEALQTFESIYSALNPEGE